MLPVLGTCLVSFVLSVSLFLMEACPALIPGSSNTFCVCGLCSSFKGSLKPSVVVHVYHTNTLETEADLQE